MTDACLVKGEITGRTRKRDSTRGYYDELYDLRNDPHEMVNQANNPEYRDVVKAMSRKLWKFAEKNGDVCINPYICCGLAAYGPGVICEEE